jgi:ketosteroid isomerase-like protein
MGRNAEIVRELFDAFGRRDTAAVLALADPDIVFTPPTGRLAGRAEPDEYVELDDRVLGTGRVYAWGVGRVIDAPAGWVWRLRDGLVVEGSVYETRRAAYEAVGLAWPPRP